LEDEVLFARIVFVPLSLLVLCNCSVPIDLSKYALQERDAPHHKTSNNFHFAKTPKVDIRKFSRRYIPKDHVVRDVEKSDIGMDMHTVRAAMTVVHPAGSSWRDQDPKFLENSAKEDKENQMLKSKTIICRGC
jgi:hypothetical protein